MKIAVALALLALACGSSATETPFGDSLGDRLLRTFLVFRQIPLNYKDAIASGMARYDYGGNGNYSCREDVGIVLTNGGSTPGRLDQTMYIYNQAGQLSGFGVRAWYLTPGPLLSRFWLPAPTDSSARDIFLTFRSGSLCNSQPNDSLPLGDTLLINRFFNIPLFGKDARAKGFRVGNCISKMGSHHWFDLKTGGPNMTWDSNNLMPVLPMYLDDGPNAGHIQAVLIASPRFQWTEPIGMYEGPFPTSLFCKNSCSYDQPACSKFANAGPWATMHWEFNDPAQATCNNAVCKF